MQGAGAGSTPARHWMPPVCKMCVMLTGAVATAPVLLFFSFSRSTQAPAQIAPTTACKPYRACGALKWSISHSELLACRFPKLSSCLSPSVGSAQALQRPGGVRLAGLGPCPETSSHGGDEEPLPPRGLPHLVSAWFHTQSRVAGLVYQAGRLGCSCAPWGKPRAWQAPTHILLRVHPQGVLQHARRAARRVLCAAQDGELRRPRVSWGP